MPKRSPTIPAKFASVDAFISWVTSIVPDGVWVYANTTHTFERECGRISAGFDVSLHLHRRSAEVEANFKHHDLTVLARWVVCNGIPELFPPPAPPRRKLTIKRPALEHHPSEPLFS